MDSVRIAFVGSFIGFADRGNDYLLGAEVMVRSRANVPELNYGSYLIDGELISLFNGGVQGERYDLTIANTGAKNRLSHVDGYVSASAQCGDEIWAAIPPGAGLPDFGESIQLTRLHPKGGPSWPIESSSRIGVTDAACGGTRFVALSFSEDPDRWQLISMDVSSGEYAVKDLNGDLSTSEIGMFGAIARVDETNYAVAVYSNERKQRFGLYEIDTDGSIKLITKFDQRGDEDALFRIQGTTLYILDSSSTRHSTLLAYQITTGKPTGVFEFDSILPELNPRGSTIDDMQFLRDFVVLDESETW